MQSITIEEVLNEKIKNFRKFLIEDVKIDETKIQSHEDMKSQLMNVLMI